MAPSMTMRSLVCVALPFMLAAASTALAMSGITKRTYVTGNDVWNGEIDRVSWKPRAFLLKGFLSEEECDWIIDNSKPHMEASEVLNSVTGASESSTHRTSTGHSFPREYNDVIERIENRAASVTMIPISHQEGVQVLRYVNGQEYKPHNDYFHDVPHQSAENGGQRVVTLLMYLTTPEEGGETVFPDAADKVSGPQWSSCAQKGLAVKPRRGDALLFYDLTADGEMDEASLHGSCPTTKGEKWSATIWIHTHPWG